MNETLSHLIDLRVQIDKKQHEIEMLMPDAIAEALTIAEANPKSKVVFQNQSGKIILHLRKQFPNPQNDIKLNRIDSDIKLRQSQLAAKCKNEIEEIQSKIELLQKQIERLEAKQDKLLCDRYVIRLRKEYAIAREQSAYFNPNLAVFLK